MLILGLVLLGLIYWCFYWVVYWCCWRINCWFKPNNSNSCFLVWNSSCRKPPIQLLLRKQERSTDDTTDKHPLLDHAWGISGDSIISTQGSLYIIDQRISKQLRKSQFEFNIHLFQSEIHTPHIKIQKQLTQSTNKFQWQPPAEIERHNP